MSINWQQLAFHFAEHRFELQNNTLIVGTTQIEEQEILESPLYIVREVQKLLN